VDVEVVGQILLMKRRYAAEDAMKARRWINGMGWTFHEERDVADYVGCNGTRL